MRIGIFDIGTRATRLLVSDTQNFVHFRKNFGSLTYLGEAFDEDENIQLALFEPTMKALSDFLKEGQKLGVQKFIAVGTAALRKAKNKDLLLALIESHLGLRVTILEKEEEAYLSLLSVFVHFGNTLKENQPIILIDQGGGSTEISCGQLKDEGYEFLGLESLELGSVSLKNRFLENTTQSVSQAYSDTLASIQETISSASFLRDYREKNPVKAFGMGSAITNMTQVKSNSKQHGIEISTRAMERKIQGRQTLYSSNNKTIQTLQNENDFVELSDTFEKDLLILYGLPVYLEILDFFRMKEITVCGYGLRYGVFFYFALPKVVKRMIALQLTGIHEIERCMQEEII